MTDDWVLEYDNGGEIYTTSVDVSRDRIEQCLSQFDGTTTFYFGFSRTSADERLHYFGEPDKRVLEGLYGRSRGGFNFVVRKSSRVSGAPVPVKCGAGPTQAFLVDPSEMLTPAEALAVMDYFRTTEELPPGYVAHPKAYLFG